MWSDVFSYERGFSLVSFCVVWLSVDEVLLRRRSEVMNFCFPIGLIAAMMASYCFKLADHFCLHCFVRFVLDLYLVGMLSGSRIFLSFLDIVSSITHIGSNFLTK
jgi:hypothetical protein